jgi:hypothetical protein
MAHLGSAVAEARGELAAQATMRRDGADNRLLSLGIGFCLQELAVARGRPSAADMDPPPGAVKPPERGQSCGSAAHHVTAKKVVPQARLERAHPCGQQILSLSRLPVPPLGLLLRREGERQSRAHHTGGLLPVNAADRVVQVALFQAVSSSRQTSS